MGRFEFYLNKRQELLVSDEIDLAAAETDQTGKKGVVLCQIGRSKNHPDKMIVLGYFVPNEYARRIKEIVDEYAQSVGIL